MTDIPITANERKAQFTGNTGLGPFAFTFNILASSDIRVIKNSTVLTLTSEYTVATNADGTGSVTLTGSGNGTALISSDILTIVGNRQLARTSDYVQGGNLFAEALNEDLDSIVIMMQQLDEKVSRTMRIDAGDVAENLLLPDQNDRKGKYLAFNAVTGDPESGPAETDVVALAAITSDIALLADIQDGTTATNAITTVSGISSNVTTVAGISGNVTTVAGNTTNINTVATDLAGVDNIGTVAGSIANVNTVAGISGNVTTVAGISANVTAVAADATDIGTVSANITNVNTVAGISANVTAVAGDATDIGTVATDLTGANTIGTVAGIAGNVTTVAGISANVTAVAGDAADIGTVATNITNVNTVAGISGNVTTVAGISADVTAVAGDATDIGTVSANISNVNTVAGISGDVTTVAADGTDIGIVATNIADVGTVAGISANVTTVAGVSADVTTAATNIAAIIAAPAEASAASASASAASVSETNALAHRNDAQSARDQSQAARDTANLHKLAAEAAATSATNTASALTGFDLDAIAASKAVTAVDVFVYDTSRDSDGGAWRKRTQHTSWYNETLNTATRGARREFPAVAVIVAESNKVTIYDGDDPALPMWMVFEGDNSAPFGILRTDTSVTSVSSVNGLITVGSGSQVQRVNFVSDTASPLVVTGTFLYNGVISQRNSSLGAAQISSVSIVNSTVNDIAMTVLPDAPIDPATGLPVPVIAVATAGGVSVIKDDRTVVDIVFTSSSVVRNIDFDSSHNIWFLHGGNTSIAASWKKYAIPNADLTGQNPTSGGLAFYSSASVPSIGILPSVFPLTRAMINGKALGANDRLTLLEENPTTKANGMVAYTTSSYQSGYQVGDIKGAFLSDTDDTDLVASGELVTNGTFDTASDWTLNGTAEISSGTAKNLASGDYIAQGFTTEAGKYYQLTFDALPGSNTGNSLVRIGTGPNSFSIQATALGATGTGLTRLFVATGTTTWVTFFQANFTAEYDNVSVKLADADRSVNNKGLIVNGTVTRTPVASGANLVSYSGFSASNYLEQPYNSALDFGTGDFSVMGWVKVSSAATTPIVSKAVGTNAFYLQATSNSVRVFLAGTLVINYAYNAPANWTHLAAYRSGTTVFLSINGEVVTSATSSADTDVADATLRIGRDHGSTGATPLTAALLRISATAPTAEQIAKIYNDERFLFQDNAQATLFGASDAVTALAHDPVTDLLHVGTSAGRSVFSGLRRVSNTTTAVGTAISASNGMVAEE